MPTRQNLTIYQGERVDLAGTVTVDGSVLDLTGATTTDLTLEIGRPGDEGIVSLSIGSGITLDADPTTGEYTATISAAATAPLVPGVRYDLEVWLTFDTYEGPVSVGQVSVVDSQHVRS